MSVIKFVLLVVVVAVVLQMVGVDVVGAIQGAVTDFINPF